MKKNHKYGVWYSPALKKCLLIMRLFLVISLIGVMQTVALNAYTQNTRISLSVAEMKLEEIIIRVENETYYRFAYDKNEIDVDKAYSVNVKNAEIKELLSRLFSKGEIDYAIVGRQIVLSPSNASAVTRQDFSVSGRVTDSAHAAFPGVTVIIKGTNSGTVTDVQGNYNLQKVAEDATLVFSFVGMKTQEIQVQGKTTINIVLTEETIGIDEVVAVGYGTVKKKDLTGAVSQINAEKLERESSSNMTALLRGALPGLNVNFSTSAKGLSSASDMMVRGQKSLRADAGDEKGANAPLIVLDGMIYYGDMSDINPVDIEMIDVLKDASSSAIYGARASNGVILITTKKGRKGKPAISVSSSIGLSSRSHTSIGLMSPEQFINWRIAGYESNEKKQESKPGYYNSPDNLPSGISTDSWKAYDGSSEASDLTSVWLNRIGFSTIEINNYKEGKTVNWEDYLFQTGVTQDYNISLSGSSDALSYYWSLGYVDKEGMWYNEDFNTIRSRINLEANVTNWLKVGTNTQFAVRDESSIPASLNMYLTPYASSYQDDGVTLMYAPTGNVSVSRHPWLSLTYQDRFQKYNNMNSKIYASLTLPFGFTFTTEYIPRFNWNRSYNWYSAQHDDYTAENGRASRENTTVFEWQVNNMLKWNRKFGQHTFDLTLVQNSEKYQYRYDGMSRNYFQPNDYLGYHAMQSATADLSITSNDQVSTGAAYLARLNYIMKDRYMITGSFRRDGYSAFGQKNPWADFGSLALGWMISEENFFKIKWIDFLKIRASYGTNGNRGVGIYDALSNLATGKFVMIEDGSEKYVSKLYTSRMANSNLKWERTGAYNSGLDFSVLKGRLKGNFDIYFMKTKDLLMERQLPDITGFASVYSNMGQVNNQGFELSLNSTNIQTSDFSWTCGFSVAHNKNKIIHLFGDYMTDEDGNMKEVDDETNEWFIGHSTDEIWDYKVLGIWQTDEKEEAAKYAREPGDFKLWDYDGDGYYTNKDKQFLGYRQPKYRVSFRNDFQYNNWYLSIKMYSYLGHKAANNHRKGDDSFYDRGTAYNVPYWTPEHPNNRWARVRSYESGFNVWEDNSFVRIDNIALTYNLPKAFLDRYKITACNISLVTQNPYVWRPTWDWMDPESQGYAPTYYSLKLNFTL